MALYLLIHHICLQTLGEFFVYNQETGHSKVWSTGATKTNSVTGDKNKAERVRSIFVPKDDKESEE